MMDNTHLDQLFDKARSMPVQTSLEETKTAFLSTVVVASTPSWKSWLTTKNIWIMTSIITAGLVAGFLWMNPSTEKTPMHSSTNQPTVKQHLETTLTSHYGFESSTDQAKEKRTSPLSVRSLALLPARIPEQNAKPLFQPITGAKPIENLRPYIPTLTTDERKANEKQKQKMIKALLKRDDKAYVYVPSGAYTWQGEVISIQSYFVQTTEVTNLEYRTFLFDLIIQGREADFLRARPDQDQWVKQLGGGMEPMVEHYFSHPAYNEYPVVNVSREGAEMYCFWLTQQVNQSAKSEKEKINDLRIPTRSEWQIAASAGTKQQPFPWDGDQVRNAKGCFLVNLDEQSYAQKVSSDTTILDGAMCTAHVRSYVPNAFGLYNMSGNAAEMVYNSWGARINPGTSGGSWLNSEAEVQIAGPDPYKGVVDAHPAIGFRVVFTYIPTQFLPIQSKQNNDIQEPNTSGSVSYKSTSSDEEINQLTETLSLLGCDVQTEYTRRLNGSIRKISIHITTKSGGQLIVRVNPFKSEDSIAIHWHTDEHGEVYLNSNSN